MIVAIDSFEAYRNFILDVSCDPLFHDPHFTYNPNNLYSSLHNKDKSAFAVMTAGAIQGVFVWLILSGERYMEMLVGLTRSESAFSEMLCFLEKRYPGYKADFVLNPKNTALISVLNEKKAYFDKEQQKMILTNAVTDISTDCVEEYSEKWRVQYCTLHSADTYWTAERILSALDRFRVLLAVKNHQVLGYLDVTHCYNVNEPFDLFVRPELPFREYAVPLLSEAVKRNKPNQMMVLVCTESTEEIAAYVASGFEKVEGQNSVYAFYQL